MHVSKQPPDDLGTIADTLEREANRAFLAGDYKPSEIPTMVWCDRWDRNHFIRFVMPEKGDVAVVHLMDRLRRRMAKKFKRHFTGVCYSHDPEWNWELAASQTAKLQELHGGVLGHE